MIDQRALRVELLLRDGVFLDQTLIALQVQFGIGQECLITLEIALLLLHGRFVGARIDLGESLPLLHFLTFGEEYLLHDAADLSAHRHRGQWRHGAKSGNLDIDIPDRRRRRSDCDGSILTHVPAAGGGRHRLLSLDITRQCNNE